MFERERSYDNSAASGKEAPPGNAVRPAETIEPARSIPNIDHRFGSGAARILGVELLDERNRATREVWSGQTVLLRISVEFLQDVTRPILGYTLRDRLGIDISACNTNYAGAMLPPARKGQIYTSDFEIHMPFMLSGSYSIAPAVADGDLSRHDMCDWIDNALIFSLTSGELIYGMLKLDVEVRNYVSGAAEGSV